MSKLGVLAIASLLFVGMSGPASAAPIAVTYGLVDAGGATAKYDPSGFGGIVGSGFGGGSLTVIYASGTTAIGGSLGGGFGAVAALAVSLTSPGFVLGNTVPAIGVGPGMTGVNIANSGAFVGPTVVTASFFAPGVPGITWTGAGSIPFAAGGPSTIFIPGIPSLSGFAGGFQFGGPIVWTLGNVLGVEVSRVDLPEPGTSGLLIMGLVGLAAFGAPKLRRR
jgi:hypothetical protein